MDSKCEYGGNRRTLCDNENCVACFKRSFASHPRSENWSRRNELRPRQITKFSHKKCWFYCPNCCHEFEIVVSNISRGQWCKYCNHGQLCDNDDCKFCEENSFRSCEMSQYWSDKNEDTPRMIPKYSNEERWFDCPNCPHDFPAIVAWISLGRWCPYCNSKKLCDNEECDFCFNMSFASNSRAVFWSEKNTKLPREVFKNSNENFLFDCPNCGHEFCERLIGISSGRWCQYCCIPPKKMCGIDVDCEFCFNKSFASCPEAKYWSKRNSKNPREVFKNSNDKFWFDCPDCDNEFEMRLYDIVNGHWCSICRYKTEKKLYKHLKTQFQDVKRQHTFEWCRSDAGRLRRFDFYIPSLNLVIELDGDQHFMQVSNWNTPENVHRIDIEKMEGALRNGISVLRFYQKEVFQNSWKYELVKKYIIKSSQYPIIKCISDTDIYDKDFSKYIIKNG
jgi:very-short-patch-repair endonuclease